MRTVEKEEALLLLADNRRLLLGDPDSSACLMCALVERRELPELIAESAHGVVVLDRFGTRPGHLLVISRRHMEDTAELPWEIYVDLQRLAYDASCVQRRVLKPVRIFNAILGAPAQLPMSFPHFHIHLLPVYDSDERARPAFVFSWSAGVLVYEDGEAHALAAELRGAWPEPAPPI
jgi:histidine triad (HIT) family protein